MAPVTEWALGTVRLRAAICWASVLSISVCSDPTGEKQQCQGDGEDHLLLLLLLVGVTQELVATSANFEHKLQLSLPLSLPFGTRSI